MSLKIRVMAAVLVTLGLAAAAFSAQVVATGNNTYGGCSYSTGCTALASAGAPAFSSTNVVLLIVSIAANLLGLAIIIVLFLRRRRRNKVVSSVNTAPPLSTPPL